MILLLAELSFKRWISRSSEVRNEMTMIHNFIRFAFGVI